MTIQGIDKPKQARIVDQLQAAKKKLDGYRKKDEVVLNEVQAIHDRIKAETGPLYYNEDADEDDFEKRSAVDSIIIGGIFDDPIQSKLLESFQDHLEEQPHHLINVKAVFESSGASLRDLMMVYVVVTQAYEFYEDHIVAKLHELLEQYKSQELDELIIENFGRNFFEQSLSGENAKEDNWCEYLAGELLEVISDKDLLLEKFSLFAGKAKLSSDEEIEYSMLSMFLVSIAGNLVSSHLDRLSYKQVDLLIDGLGRFGNDEGKDELLKKLVGRLRVLKLQQ